MKELNRKNEGKFLRLFDIKKLSEMIQKAHMRNAKFLLSTLTHYVVKRNSFLTKSTEN